MRCRELGLAGLLIATFCGCTANQTAGGGWGLSAMFNSKSETDGEAKSSMFARFRKSSDGDESSAEAGVDSDERSMFAAFRKSSSTKTAKPKDASKVDAEVKMATATTGDNKLIPGKAKRKPQPNTCVKAGQYFEQVGDKAEDAAVRQAKYEQARKAYQQALDIDRKHQSAMVSLARLHEKQNNYELAVATYKRACDLHPKDAALWFDLGMCWGRQKEWDSAVECLKKAAALEPSNAQYSNYLGWGLARAGYEQESLAHFRKKMGDAKANYNVALMMHHTGQKEKCRQYLQASLKVDPNLSEAQVLLAKIEPGNAPSVNVTTASVPASDSPKNSVTPASSKSPSGPPAPPAAPEVEKTSSVKQPQ